MNRDKRIVIVPCSGIGKSLGTVSREAAYELCDNLRPGDTQLVALFISLTGPSYLSHRRLQGTRGIV